MVEFWRRNRQPWLLEILAQGIRTPQIRFHALRAAQKLPTDQEVIRRLWPAVKAIVQNESDVYVLQPAVGCLHNWADPRAVPPLRGLKKRWNSISGPDWEKNKLSKKVDETLAELNKKHSLKDRLLGR